MTYLRHILDRRPRYGDQVIRVVGPVDHRDPVPVPLNLLHLGLLHWLLQLRQLLGLLPPPPGGSHHILDNLGNILLEGKLYLALLLQEPGLLDPRVGRVVVIIL